MTRQQKKLVKSVVRNPTATLVEHGANSGYTSAQHVHRALRAPAVVDALSEVKSLMNEDERLRYKSLLNTLAAGLEATDVRSLKVDGTQFKVNHEVADFAVRRNYMRDALELHGVLGNKVEGTSASGPINIAIILAGGGSDAEKTALADALLAARLSRGLHPLENRDLTSDEAATYQRSA